MPIEYGYPSEKAFLEAEQGKFHLGGCVISDDDPNWYCRNCDRKFLEPQLSKSRFVAGHQCQKMLWWKVHEPEAPELAAAPGDVQPRLDRGNWVGAAARASVPGGLLIDEPLHDLQARAEATARAIASGAQVIYEASVLVDGLFASVDILERKRGGFVLVEVKSSLDVKSEHIPDVAFQVHAFRLRGVVIKRAEVMHLNRAARHPDLSNLFVRRNVTSQVDTALRSVPRRARSLLASL